MKGKIAIKKHHGGMFRKKSLKIPKG